MISEALAAHDIPALREFQRHTPTPDLAHIPGDSGLPMFGHFFPFLRDLHGFLNRQYENYGPVFKFNTVLVKSMFVLGPEANRIVFQNEGKQFSNFLAWNNAFANLFDNNILERDFDSHKAHRRVLQLAFKRPAIEGHMELMNPLIKQRLDQWQTGRPILAMDHVKTLLLDLGANVFLGEQLGEQTDRLNQAFIDVVKGTTDPIRRKSLWFMPYAKGIRGREVLSEFIFANIEQRRKIESRDLFSQICHLKDENGSFFTDAEVRDHIIFMLFAAHDTTTSALSAALYALASNPEWQQTLRDEICEIDREEIELGDLEKMVKTGWTFKEALRMHPALCVMPRYALQDVEIHGHHIPANSTVMVSSLFTHYMPEYWSNPNEFDPQRFAPERAEDKKDFFQYVPFGGGAHKCLGMHFAETQGKMFLYHLLRNFRVSKDPKMVKYKYNNVPLTFPTDGLPLTLQRI